MQPLKLEILPITEYCSMCDYEASRSLNSHSGTCPKCGGHSVHSGLRPVKTIRCYISPGHYNFCDPHETQYQYVFQNLPQGLHPYFLMYDEVIDASYSPLEIAEALKHEIDQSIGKDKKEKINKVVEYLRSVEDEQLILRSKRRIQQLEYELYQLYQNLPSESS
jgi:hypothetical protein